MTLPSSFDNLHMPIAREFINSIRLVLIKHYLKQSDIICDIGAQGQKIPELRNHKVLSFDIIQSTNPDILGDITKTNQNIPEEFFDALMCTEVLEHVVDPFSAIREIRRIVKIGGYILITTPLNARIHGPIPDCWRFTEFGLKVLLRDFEIIHFNKLETPDRNLFPLHYGIIAKKSEKSTNESDPRMMKFEKVD